MKVTGDFWSGLGIALIILSIGGCNYLYEKGEAVKRESVFKTSPVVITNSFNRIEK